jgi:hypothetical protein
MEEWRPVPGLEDRYAISSYGRLMRTAAGKKTHAGKILAPAKAKTGYLMSQLGYGRARKSYYIHRLVAEAFLPPPNSEHRRYVAHRNGDRTDNRVENLYWATPAENSYDAIQHGTAKGDHSARYRVLNDDDIRAIRQDHRPATRIAAEYGLSVSGVSAIRRGLTHKHVPPQPGDYTPTKRTKSFTDEQVRAIRRDPRSSSVLARELETSFNTINDIRRRKFYAWVDD